MSKRSRRQKRAKQQRKKGARLTGPVLTDQGIRAFKQSDYTAAIRAWEAAQRKPDVSPQLPVLLAEAYFRWGVSGSAQRNADLEKAVELQPADSRYRFHLALTYHQQGKLGQAQTLYRQLLAEELPYERAAFPLAQLLIQQKKPLSKDSVWGHLDEEQRAELAIIEALARKKARSTLARQSSDLLPELWQGLRAIALQDHTVAQHHLQAALEQTGEQPSLAGAVIRYYLGVIAANAGQFEQAFAHWEQAQANGFDAPHLRRNLAVAAYHQAIQEQQAGHPEQAAQLLDLVNDQQSVNGKLAEFKQQLHWELGYAAAQKQEWEQALHHWQAVEAAGSDDRKLLFNLALAYQKADQPFEAAQHWRQLLRRRPRKADHPDALTDQQVARIWQNVAENYSMAGEYEEAITTYRTALKWAPENLDLRLKMVDALQTEGRWQAAENELNRILKKDPDNVPALTLLAESYSNDFFPDRASETWQRVLTLEPQNPVARQQLAGLYENRGLMYTRWGNYDQALETLKEGLSLVPDSVSLIIALGGVYADIDELEQARSHFEQALTLDPDNLSSLFIIFLIWLENESEPDLQETFERIKTFPRSIPFSFFSDLLEHCSDANESGWVDTILAYLDTQYQHDDDALVELAFEYKARGYDSKAVSILRRVLSHNSKHITANIRLGSIYYEMGQTRLGKRHWDKAERQAKIENDIMSLNELRMIKDYLIHGRSFPRSPLEMILNMTPDLKEELLRTAPPEVAELLRDMGSDELAALFANMGLDDDYYDDDDEFDFFSGPGPRRK